MRHPSPHIGVIGAGIGGLSAALRLAYAGAQVSVFERHATPGGKMRTLPSAAGPVDAGPTVLTMKPVFEALFAETGSRLQDHITLQPETLLARHFWPDGTRLDLVTDRDANAENIARVFGPKSAREFRSFDAKTQMLFDAFDAPMMQASAPSLLTLSAQVARRPALARLMEPLSTLGKSLARQFGEPKLAQLFGRYATYVGGRPDASPALLGLIWQAEAKGVWHVEGGMHQLARAIEARAADLGAQFHYNAHVDRIELQNGSPAAVITSKDRTPVDAVLFNGDPNALATGLLGPSVRSAVAPGATTPRSLSAAVLSFAAKAQGMPLAAHNVFFCDDPNTEFGPIAKGSIPRDATLYVCAQDRFGARTPDGIERFEIILNAPSVTDNSPPKPEDIEQCHMQIIQTLRGFGLTFTPTPPHDSLTMPSEFAAMFPASGGALYGRSPHGMMAAFKRPTVRSRMPGLYLVGGGVHPGAGIPMATLCARHAAEAIKTDLSLTSTSPRAAMLGGTSTGSPTMAPVPSRSSAS